MWLIAPLLVAVLGIEFFGVIMDKIIGAILGIAGAGRSVYGWRGAYINPADGDQDLGIDQLAAIDDEVVWDASELENRIKRYKHVEAITKEADKLGIAGSGRFWVKDDELSTDDEVFYHRGGDS